MILLWINVYLYEVREVTAPEADVPVIQRRTSQSELFHCRAPHCNKKTHFRAGKHLFSVHLPEGRVLVNVVQEGDRPEEGHVRAVPADAKDDRDWVDRDLLSFLCSGRRHHQGLRAHLTQEARMMGR